AARAEDLHVLVALGDVGPHQVVRALGEAAREAPAPPPVPRRPRPGKRPKASRSPVTVVGVGNLLVQVARCCQPLPGEPVAGYLTRGRGLTVHRADCATLLRLIAAHRAGRCRWNGAAARRARTRWTCWWTRWTASGC